MYFIAKTHDSARNILKYDFISFTMVVCILDYIVIYFKRGMDVASTFSVNNFVFWLAQDILVSHCCQNESHVYSCSYFI